MEVDEVMAAGTSSVSPASSSRPSRLLAQAFARFKKHNPSQSLRAVAARLDVSPSYLSRLISGKKRLTAQMVQPLGRALHMDQHELKRLQRALLEEIESTRLTQVTGLKTLERDKPEVRLERYQKLGRDQYWLLERWYYLPILNLITTQGARGDAAWIARRLSMNVSVVEGALSQLEAAKLLRRSSSGELQRTRLKIRFPTSQSHAAVRAFHARGLEQALRRLEPGSASPEAFRERLISGISFAGSSAKFAEAQVILSEAMYKVAELMACDECDEVYHMGLQLYKVSTPAD